MPLTITFCFSDECHALVWRDIDGNSLLHIAARLNHHDLAQVILHKESDSMRVNQALLETNRNHKTPSDLATDTKLKALLDWAREQVDFYRLLLLPKALIFYTTQNRAGYEKELESIVTALSRLSIEARVVKDPTEKDIFSDIRRNQTGGEKFAQIVIVMSHGDRGHVKAADKLVQIRDILLQMNAKPFTGQPKVSSPNTTNLAEGVPTAPLIKGIGSKKLCVKRSQWPIGIGVHLSNASDVNICGFESHR